MAQKDNVSLSRDTTIILSESSQYQQTYRRVKDCCAHLYNLTQSWSSLNSIAFDTASKLMNSLIEEQYVVESDSHVLSDMSELKKRLEGKIVEQHETLHTDLCNILLQMDMIVTNLGLVSKNLQSSSELLALQGVEDIPLLNTLSITYFAECASHLYQSYSEEQHLRKVICDDIFSIKDKDTMIVYLSCWLHKPCISDEVEMKLESLLIDIGLQE